LRLETYSRTTRRTTLVVVDVVIVVPAPTPQAAAGAGLEFGRWRFGVRMEPEWTGCAGGVSSDAREYGRQAVVFDSLKALPFKGVKSDGLEPQVLIVLNARRAGGLGGDGVTLMLLRASEKTSASQHTSVLWRSTCHGKTHPHPTLRPVGRSE
jgi:hypothetical protein